MPAREVDCYLRANNVQEQEVASHWSCKLEGISSGWLVPIAVCVCVCVCVCVKLLSRVRLFVTLWTVAHQAPLSMGFSRQEYWSGLPFPSPGDLPNPGIEPGSPALQANDLSSEPPRKLPIAISVIKSRGSYSWWQHTGKENCGTFLNYVKFSYQ